MLQALSCMRSEVEAEAGLYSKAWMFDEDTDEFSVADKRQCKCMTHDLGIAHVAAVHAVACSAHGCKRELCSWGLYELWLG